MKKLFFLFSILFATTVYGQEIKVLLVTGGHGFDTTRFFQLFDALDGIRYTAVQQPDANRMIARGEAASFDVLVFYDMWETISEEEKKGYLQLLDAGKPFLFMHHALVSYQNWPEFEKIVGGRYVEKNKAQPQPAAELSTYRHDVWVDIQVVDPKHPVTAGFSDFRLFDEVYGNYRVGAQVVPLLKTNHPESTPVIAWENRYRNARIVFLQPGHDANAYNDVSYRKLVRQAILYLAGKK